MREPRATPRRRHRPTIGFLTAWLSDLYAGVAWSGVADAARERDANVINLVTSRLNSPLPEEAPAAVLFDLIDPRRLDGLVVFAEMLYHFTNAAAMAQFLARYRPLPMTSVGILPGLPGVMLDIAAGVREMTSHLIERHGHRRIALLSGPAGEETAEAMVRGYGAALAAHGIPLDARLITPPAPSWGADLGRAGVQTLLDARGLRPGRDFDAVVGCGDYESLAFVAALQARGFRVPHDVAVTGFNNLEVTRFATPGLTTVDRHIAELSRRATTMLLDLLAGSDVPEQVILAPELVVRRSCGCLPQAVVSAATAPLPAPPLPAPPDSAVAAVARAGSHAGADHLSGLDAAWAERLCAAFTDDLSGRAAGAFLAAIEDLLNRVVAAGGDVTAWQAVLSALRRHLPPAGPPAEDLLHQARIMVSDHVERVAGRQRVEAAGQVALLAEISRALITTFDVDGLLAVLARELPRLGIARGYLSLYDDPAHPAASATLQLAYDESRPGGRPPGARQFPTSLLVPDAALPANRRFNLVVQPLYFGNESLGLLALEMGPRDGQVYQALRQQVSSALKGARLAMRNVELYQEADQARRVAEEANQLKSRFLSMVSHELRTPLSLIAGTIDLMLHESDAAGTPLPDTFRRDIDCVRTSAEHLFRLIGDVLDLASSQAGELRLACEPLDLADVLRDVSLLGRPLAREKGLAWRADIPLCLPRVLGDRTRLRQVTLNLVSNAVKFTEQGEVALTASVTGPTVTVAVSDTGVGIPAADQAAIFDEFRRSERTVERGYGGIGLGLAVSRRLIELHGGQIGVCSSGEEGSGSTFYYTLPALADQPAGPTAPDEPGEPAARVVVVADADPAAERLREHLTRHGFEVVMLDADDCGTWLARLVTARPTAVVLGRPAAAERGAEIVKVFREIPGADSVPIVFYALDEDGDSGAVLELDVLAKPVPSASLERLLERFEPAGPDATAQPSPTFLVVDDDPAALDLHVRALRSHRPDCDVLGASGGREALEIMGERVPDLVLLDLMMPGVDGFEVLQRMREADRTRDVPVVIITAQVLTPADVARLQRGVAAVLSKGLFSTAEVIEHIEAALTRRKRLSSEAQRVVRQAIATIHAHYAEPLSRRSLAGAVAVSAGYLTRCFRQEMGITPITYLNRYRVQQARRLLERGDMSVTQVALAVGFSDGNYFARVFRQVTGVSPRAAARGG